MESILEKYRKTSRGYCLDRHAIVFKRLLLGPACYLNWINILTLRITHVINCAEDSLCPATIKHALGSKYKCLNCIDHPMYPILEKHYDEFEKTMDAFLRDPLCLNVYVHCQAGINRSACLIIAYVVRRFGVPVQHVVENVAKQRPCILTNQGFQKQLLEFK